MSHFAEVINSVVQRVIVAEQDFIDSGIVGPQSNWVQCSYNNRIRNIFPGTGYIYDKERDIFYPPQPYPSWVLKEHAADNKDPVGMEVLTKTFLLWSPPIDRPTDGKIYNWNEESTSWVEVKVPTSGSGV